MGILEIDLSSPDIDINGLFDYLYHSTGIGSIEYEGKLYYERSSMWTRTDNDEKRGEWDEDVECEAYWGGSDDEDGEHVKPEIYPDDADVKYNIEYSHDTKKNDEENQTMEELFNRIEGNFDDTVLTGYNKIVMVNTSGENGDHRGSNHCKINLKYHETFSLEGPVKLVDFCSAMYRIKSHKWDKWYELFTGARTKVENDILFILVSFDHGS